MLSSLAQHPEVEQYLKTFPRAQWEKCTGLTLRLGIRTAKSLYPYGVTIDGLTKAVLSSSDPIPDTEEIKDKLNRLKATLEARRIQIELSPKSQASKVPGRLQSPPAAREKQTQLRIPAGERSVSSLVQPPFRMTSRGSVEAANADAKQVPKHLKVVESKIKADVKRDIERFKGGEVFEKHNSPAEVPRQRPQTDSDRREDSTRPSPRPSGLSRAEVRAPLDFSTAPRTLAEPKTNLAILEKLSGKANSPKIDSKRMERRSKERESSVLRIADDFLSDPLMATLSAHGSPKFSASHWLH